MAQQAKTVVIGKVNCERCNTLNEEKEITQPSNKQIRSLSFHPQYYLCSKCGLYVPTKFLKVKYHYL